MWKFRDEQVRDRHSLASPLPLGGKGVGEDSQAHKAKNVDVGDEEEVVRGYEGVRLGHDALQHELKHCKQKI